MEFEYEDILDALEEGSCVLFIGPRLYQDAEKLVVDDKMHSHLQAQKRYESLVARFYQEDGFFLFKNESSRRPMVRMMRKFYEQEGEQSLDVLQKLARLPFSLIVSLMPNNLLEKAFIDQRQEYLSDFYFRNEPPKDYVEPSAERPLIYNMLGDLSKPESLVLTHKDLFSYLESIFKGKSMAPELRKLIQDARTFIFLGLPFEKWYMQLLLRVLYHISSRLESLEQYASTANGMIRHKIFEDEFQIKFVPNEGVDFVNQLYNLAEEEDLLKAIPEETEQHTYRNMLLEAKEYIKKDKIKNAIAKLTFVLEKHLPATAELEAKVILQEQVYNNIRNQILAGTARESEYAEQRRAIQSLLQYINETKEFLKL
jgi:hypothetical protein